MGVQRVSHLGICVSDLSRSLRFYRDGLGFREESTLDVSGPHVDQLLSLQGTKLHAVYLVRDGLRLELLSYTSPATIPPTPPRPMNQPGLTHLSLRVTDLEETIAQLRRAGAPVLEATKIGIPALHTAAIFVTDPDGTRIELVEAPGDPTSPPA
jgi:catechol 2,3-dioxygenase-like lactoylglutathione lyase family enzyme